MEELIREKFVRIVREAQQVRQGELARQVGVSQPALTRFEKSKSTLSEETLEKICDALSINPGYLKGGYGNPFRHSLLPIRMILPQTRGGGVDTTVLRLVADNNESATFLFLLPDVGAHASRALSRKGMVPGVSAYALLVMDSAGNAFIFKIKDGKYFDRRNIVDELAGEKYRAKNNFLIYGVVAGEELCRQIEDKERLTNDDAIKLIISKSVLASRNRFEALINMVWNHPSMAAENATRKSLEKKMEDLEDIDLDKLMQDMIPELAEVIKKHFE